VQLSDDAVQFQEASLLFGNSDGSGTQTSESASDSILQSLQSSLSIQSGVAASTTAGSSGTTAAASDSTPDLASLFGTTTTTNPVLSTYI
jgi:hypothetical protein